MFALTPSCYFIHIISRNPVMGRQCLSRCKVDVARSDVLNDDGSQTRCLGLANVFKIRHLLHVCGVATRPHFAAMMELDGMRNLANVLFIHEAMRTARLGIDCPDSVPVFINEPLPYPAWSFKSAILFNVVDWRQTPTMTANPAARLSFDQPQRAIGCFCNLCRLAATATTQSERNSAVVVNKRSIGESAGARAKYWIPLLFKLFHGTMGLELNPTSSASGFNVRHWGSFLGKGVSEMVGTVRETVRRIASYTIPSPMHCIPNYTRSGVLILGGS